MTIRRRDMLERTLALAAASLAGMPRGGAAEAPATTPRRVGPNDKLRVAVVGTNGRGGEHISQWLAHPETELAAICDCDPAAFGKYEKRFASLQRPPQYEKDIRKLLERKDIDLVSIASPNHWHALMAIWAMQAGKDVYVEKPCSHTVEEGRVITQWARKLGKMCQMGAQSRSMTGMRETIDFVRSGKLGAVKVAHALCYKRRPSIGLVDTPAPLPPGLDFDLWAGPAPAEVPIRQRLHYDWHWDKRTGNGDIGNQNPHELDKARWGLGKAEFPRRVVSLGGRLGYRDNGDVANSQVTLFQWDDALLISDVRGLEIKTPVTFGLAGGPLAVGNIWWGTEGYAVSTNYQSGVAFDYDGHELGKWSGGSSQAHFANLVTAIKSRNHTDLVLDIEDGHLSSALAHLGNVSWALGTAVPAGTRPTLSANEAAVKKTLEGFEAHLAENGVDFAETKLFLGRELEIDPKAERALDSAANALFTKEYRKGYELPRV
ncbi:MAG: Gfo/Idh/MocA family oxidoreductase [Planctomycetes bacterium]|nr:Gfo/Idh/MocA family oxidoreductase [Planctomycetota bacterium]